LSIALLGNEVVSLPEVSNICLCGGFASAHAVNVVFHGHCAVVSSGTEVVGVLNLYQVTSVLPLHLHVVTVLQWIAHLVVGYLVSIPVGEQVAPY